MVSYWLARGLDEVGRMPEWFFQADEWAGLLAAGRVTPVDGGYRMVA